MDLPTETVEVLSAKVDSLVSELDTKISESVTKAIDERYDDLGTSVATLSGDVAAQSELLTSLSSSLQANAASLTFLVRFLRNAFGIGPDRVYGHCDFKATECSGRHLRRFVETLRAGGR